MDKVKFGEPKCLDRGVLSFRQLCPSGKQLIISGWGEEIITIQVMPWRALVCNNMHIVLTWDKKKARRPFNRIKPENS